MLALPSTARGLGRILGRGSVAAFGAAFIGPVIPERAVICSFITLAFDPRPQHSSIGNQEFYKHSVCLYAPFSFNPQVLATASAGPEGSIGLTGYTIQQLFPYQPLV